MGTMVDMVLVIPTTDMALDTTDMDSDTTARGLLRLSPRPRLIPTTLVDTMVDMVLVMPTTDMALDTMDMGSDTTARGLLMLRLIPTTMVDTMVDMDMVLATTAMDVAFMATMDKSTNPYLVPDLHQLRDLDLHQDLSVNQVLPPCQ